MKNAKKNGENAGCRGKYGIKAYGKWHCFPTREAYKTYLAEWIAGTEGAEQGRAVDAYVNLLAGINKTDTDAPKW